MTVPDPSGDLRAGAGAGGPAASRFEDGLRFLATALALRDAAQGPEPGAGAVAVTAACDALRCFLDILDTGARRHVPDPAGEIPRLRAQCEALLAPSQTPGEVLGHALAAARLARDQASRVLAMLTAEGGA